MGIEGDVWTLEGGGNRGLHCVFLTRTYSGNQMKNEMGRGCDLYGEKIYVYRVLVGKPEGKRLLGRPDHRWEDNMKIDIEEMRSEGMDWIDLALDRDRCHLLVNAVLNLQVP